MVIFNEEKQEKKIEELHKEEAEELAQSLSQHYSLPYIDLSRYTINTDALRSVAENDARAAGLAAFDMKGRLLQVVIMTPSNEKIKEILEGLESKGFKPNVYLGSKSSVERAWEYYKEISKAVKSEAGLIDVSGERLDYFLKNVKNTDDLGKFVQETLAIKGHGISQILEIVLAGAIAIDSSDIHIEPQEEEVRLRFRLDGVLNDVTSFKADAYKLILSRVKLVSGLKLNVKAAAQDGRFTIRANEGEIEIRTSVIPGAYGESIVLRILNPKAISVPLKDLGMEPRLLEIFKHEISKPNALILVTGPTGSGKTTTLYAFLREVNNSETKIITIEDPIEYHLKGVSQTQVSESKGYTFLEGLRAALRQDPDIIMVGEIRDSETAKIAINAALTGHLVFSTLHTNNAAGAIPRIIDLGVNPKIISSALTVIIAQRLVRKLCNACKKEDEPTADERTLFTNILSSINTAKIEIPTIGKIYRAMGCEKCNKTGYKGRTGVYEAILMDELVSATITQNPNERDIIAAAAPQGILDMRQDGVVKILKGVTTLEELERVVEVRKFE